MQAFYKSLPNTETEMILLITRGVGVVLSILGSLLLAEATVGTIPEKGITISVLMAAVATLWYSLRLSYESRLKDKDEFIDKLEERIKQIERELRSERETK